MPTPSPPRLSLLALPNELKSHIVDLVSRQDAAYAARLAAARKGGHPLQTVAVDGFGKSLQALRLVNKELASLGAKHLCSTVRADRALDSIFHFHILPLYSHYIQCIKFSEGILSAATRHIIGSLHMFPSLSEFQFDSEDAVGHFLGHDWAQGTVLSAGPTITTQYAFSAKAFTEAARRVVTLQIGDFWNGYSAALFLQLFPNVKTLRMHFYVHLVIDCPSPFIDGTPTIPSQLAALLSRFPSTNCLTLVDIEHSGLDGRVCHQLLAQAATKDYKLRLRSTYKPSIRPEEILAEEVSEDDAQQALDAASAQRTLDFGTIRVQCARAEGSLDRELKASLEPLERLRMAWAD
ncbi:hypothetical protein RQP46_006763 [Phenoliferia psychrophenolica]